MKYAFTNIYLVCLTGISNNEYMPLFTTNLLIFQTQKKYYVLQHFGKGNHKLCRCALMDGTYSNVCLWGVERIVQNVFIKKG